ncbi:MAG: hypothetical protein COY75_04695 [Nitrospirae bacterium CG_4_10_14_0_8_um_filter_41_23]|nr:MAG: hypothetical protein AUK38_04590 [Nitrospirae bacterium CG2_30_41_42]PIQ93491.1 MAG: hypothetical protein COV68_09520 [Nitrospirae bacterium CG11_big_fil_rev_8_21_14_0_20_41_14]PIV43431.1 MAG: hypothetical protein COS27_04840 [Nitrospirae bacterium CG02_land_8_20_14_3_00_41_53]PIW87907.1 MAG: hypothetical protein COZ94_02480 [Nitrospirae bacterium CG_4_8_14_3_um_filter_41_47]PIY87057.1 MAG: hypothetical protein COY75_04695 [Nitrospirae bacterium CG_4_10_14_0_8_um_filter_41_23]PJA79063.
MIKSHVRDTALLFYILINPYIPLLSQDKRKGKAFLFFTYLFKYKVHKNCTVYQILGNGYSFLNVK